MAAAGDVARRPGEGTDTVVVAHASAVGRRFARRRKGGYRMRARNWTRCLLAIIGVLTVLGAGAAAAQPEELEGTCSNYQLTPNTATVSSAGGSGTLDITWDWEAPPIREFCIANCSSASCGDQTGSVRSSATWLSGTKRGNDEVDYTVDAHTGTSSRTATLTVAGATFTATQNPPCPGSPDSASSTSLSFEAAGGRDSVSVTGRAGCSWSVSSNASWIGVTPSTVSNSDSVTVTVPSGHAGEPGTVTIGGLSIPVNVGCPPSPDGASTTWVTFLAAGGRDSVSVTGSTRCSWSVDLRPRLDRRDPVERVRR